MAGMSEAVDGGERCVVCGGAKVVPINNGDASEFMGAFRTCAHCNGTGIEPQPVDGGEAQDARERVLASARRVYAEVIANAADAHHKAAAWAQMRTLELYPPNEPTSPDPDEPLTFEDGAHNGYVAGYEQGRADLLHEVSERHQRFIARLEQAVRHSTAESNYDEPNNPNGWHHGRLSAFEFALEQARAALGLGEEGTHV